MRDDTFRIVAGPGLADVEDLEGKLVKFQACWAREESMERTKILSDLAAELGLQIRVGHNGEVTVAVGVPNDFFAPGGAGFGRFEDTHAPTENGPAAAWGNFTNEYGDPIGR